MSFPPFLEEKCLSLASAFITEVTTKLNQRKHIFSGGAVRKLILLMSSADI